MYTDRIHNSNDWTTLINEKDLENSVIERIIRNEFYPEPVVYQKAKINWAEWLPGGKGFRTNQNDHENHQEPKRNRPFIPALRSFPQYPRISTLTLEQHLQCLRVLAAKNQHVQPKGYGRPSKADYKVFEQIKEVYKKEQLEFLKWAKLCWINGECVRALRPKPLVEGVYEAEFRVRAAAARALPPTYWWAAQIPLHRPHHQFQFVHKQDLINVDILELPAVEYPEEINSSLIIMKPIPLPEPCAQHPCKFVLPNADSVSTLPLDKVHEQLAQFGAENDVQVVVSESALRCLLETHRSWKLPVSVVPVLAPDGELRNVLVVGSEFNVQKQFAPHRTHRAYTHLLRHAFAPSAGHYKINKTASSQRSRNSECNEESARYSDAPPGADGRYHIEGVNKTPSSPHRAKDKSVGLQTAAVTLEEDLDISSDEERLQIVHELAATPAAPCEKTTLTEGTAGSPLRNLIEDDLDVSSDDDGRLLIDDKSDDGNDESRIVPKTSISMAEPNFCATNNTGTIIRPTDKKQTLSELVTTKHNYEPSPSKLSISGLLGSPNKRSPEKPKVELTTNLERESLTSKPEISLEADKCSLEMQTTCTINKDASAYPKKPSVAAFFDVDITPNPSKANISTFLDSSKLTNSKFCTQNRSNSIINTRSSQQSAKANFGFEPKSTTPYPLKGIVHDLARNEHNKPVNGNKEVGKLNNDKTRSDKHLSDNNFNNDKAVDTNSKSTKNLLSFGEPVAHSSHETKGTAPDRVKKSSLKQCLTNSESSEPRTSRSKRNLNYSHPVTGDVDQGKMSITESDSDYDITEIIPLSCHSGARCKPKLLVTRTYGLRSKNQPKAQLANVTKNTKSKETKCKTEDTHERRRSSRLSAGSKIDETNSPIKFSRRNSSSNNNGTLRRSSRLNSTVCSKNDETDEQPITKSPLISATTKTQKNKRSCSSSQKISISPKSQDSKVPSGRNSAVPSTSEKRTRKNSTVYSTSAIKKRLSPRKKCFSECRVESKEGTEIENLNPPRYSLRSYSVSKIEKAKTRRKSLPANYYSDIKIRHPIKRYYLPSSKLINLNRNNTLETLTNEQVELSERTKRYFLRSGSLACSKGDETDKADSQPTKRKKRYTRRSNSTSFKYNDYEMSDTDLTKQSANRPRRRKSKYKTKQENCPSLSEIPNTKKVHKINNTEEFIGKALPETQVDNTDEIITLEIDIELTEFKTPKVEINDSDQAQTTTNETETFELTQSQNTGLPETYIKDIIPSNEKLQSKLHSLFSNSSDDSDNDTRHNKRVNEVSTNMVDTIERNEQSQLENSLSQIEGDLEVSDSDDDTGHNKRVNEASTNMRDTIERNEESQLENSLSQIDEHLEPSELEQTESTQAEDQYTSKDQTEINGVDYSDNKRFHKTKMHRSMSDSTIASDDCNINVDSMKELTNEDINEIIGVNNCVCKGTLFEIPPPRSFKKWQLSNKTSFETFDVIIHMSHKVRKGENEVIIEPIVEYQPEYGAAVPAPGTLRALALQLMLRAAPSLLNVRLDYDRGEVILIEHISSAEFFERHGEQTAAIADTLHSTLAQLRQLRPGQYILDHDSQHGPNAMVYTTQRLDGDAATLSLHSDNIQMEDARDADHVRRAPPLCPALLPFHKFRRILPCAFTPYKNQVKEDKKKPAAPKKLKHPPQAIQWKKKKKKGKKVRQT